MCKGEVWINSEFTVSSTHDNHPSIWTRLVSTPSTLLVPYSPLPPSASSRSAGPTCEQCERSRASTRKWSAHLIPVISHIPIPSPRCRPHAQVCSLPMLSRRKALEPLSAEDPHRRDRSTREWHLTMFAAVLGGMEATTRYRTLYARLKS